MDCTHFINVDIFHGGEEVTVEVEFAEGWFRPGNRRGHPDTWTPDEGENAEIIAVKLDNCDITRKLSKTARAKIQKACDTPPAREEYDGYDPDYADFAEFNF
jgi:hypothetical protein